jgi:hypothetical protein
MWTSAHVRTCKCDSRPTRRNIEAPSYFQTSTSTTMSRASVEQALTGLIPALNGPLPPELLELALSLLARSRSVANSLKSDEEIARPYACAQLACERQDKKRIASDRMLINIDRKSVSISLPSYLGRHVPLVFTRSCTTI